MITKNVTLDLSEYTLPLDELLEIANSAKGLLPIPGELSSDCRPIDDPPIDPGVINMSEITHNIIKSSVSGTLWTFTYRLTDYGIDCGLADVGHILIPRLMRSPDPKRYRLITIDIRTNRMAFHSG